MRKIILTIEALFILFISCDKIYHNKLYIINNCNELINISLTDTWNKVDTFSVKANSTFMFDEGKGIMRPKGIIKQGFVDINIVKNGIKSKVNYQDFNKWVYVEKEDKYHSELYLPVNPKDFE
jgi:hypothetical protein